MLLHHSSFPDKFYLPNNGFVSNCVELTLFQTVFERAYFGYRTYTRLSTYIRYKRTTYIRESPHSYPPNRQFTIANFLRYLTLFS